MTTTTPGALPAKEMDMSAGRFRIALPAWGWGAALFRPTGREELVSREEMLEIFGTELRAPAVLTRKARTPGDKR